MQPTIRDVAKRAGTSVSTVSRVLTGQGPVAEETRRRVLQAIDELGYQPNALARGLVQKRTGTVGVVLPDVSNPFSAEVLRGMGDVAAAHGLHLLLVNADLSFTKEAEGFAVLQEKQVDGVIYTSGMVTPKHRELFRKLRRPVVLAATFDPEGEFPAVLVDSRRGAQMAMDYLTDLGHRRIAVINGLLGDNVAGLPRWEGYQDAARQKGVPLPPELVAEGDYRLESGYWAMDRILNRKERPTAVAAASDLMAIGAMNAILDRGLRVPEDISVVGFDNIWMAGAVRPGLTTVAQPMYEIGARAVSLLAQAIAGQCEVATHWIQPHLVVRHSTAPPTVRAE
jgi:LacI family transcriptional regulator